MKFAKLITAALMLCGIAATTIIIPAGTAQAGDGLCGVTGFTDMPCSFHSSNGDWYTKTVGDLGIDVTNYNFYNMNPSCGQLCLPNPLGGQSCFSYPNARNTPGPNDYLGGNVPQTYRLWCGSNANHQSGDHLHYKHK